MRFRKILLICVFSVLTVSLWSETSFYWDIGGVGLAGKFNKDEIRPDLQFHIGEIYLAGEKSHLVLDVKPVILNLVLVANDSAYPDLPQRDLTGMYLVNAKLSWLPLETEYIWLGPFVSANYLNPFNITDARLCCGAEFSLLLPFNDFGPLGDSILAKVFTLEAGAEFDSTDNFKPSFYGKLGVHLGFLGGLFSK